MSQMFLHELPDFGDLIQATRREIKSVSDIQVEKDYWIMHCLWGLQQKHYDYELKGGTSLSKGFGIIERFSEDIDIQIHPKSALRIGQNHQKPKDIESRKQFFDELALELCIPGLTFTRDSEFDDASGKMRSAGIRGYYQSAVTNSTMHEANVLNEGVLLEAGFDQTTPFEEITISSWVFDKAYQLKLDVIDTRALNVKCYYPEYTFVEKLQTISTKFRIQQKNSSLPKNFIRNYYDVYQLLLQDRVTKFIGTEEYHHHKRKRFPASDIIDLKMNEAFLLSDPKTFELYQSEYQDKSALYYGKQPSFSEVMNAIQFVLPVL